MIKIREDDAISAHNDVDDDDFDDDHDDNHGDDKLDTLKLEVNEVKTPN